jgi:hypothetical protein
MFKNRFMGACATAVLCGALVVPAGCKKKEEAKKPEAATGDKAAAATGVEAAKAAVEAAVAPLPPDVELVAGDNIAGWMTFQSLDGLFNAADAIGGKLALTPPGASTKQQVMAQLTAALGDTFSGLEWLDTAKSVHVAFQDDGPAAPAAPGAAPAPAADPTGGIVAVLHVTDKAKTLTAMTSAKKGADAEGHEAKIEKAGKTLYVDFVGNALVFTMTKDRFAKVKGFVERLDKVASPSLVYLGISVEDLAKTRATELDGFFKQFEAMGAAMPANPAMPNQAAVMQTYSKMIRSWANDMRRVEILVGADVTNTRFEIRMTAKDGTKLAKQLSAGKGRTPKDIVNLLPANSYLTFAASVDPAASLEGLDDSLVMVKDMLKLDQAGYDAFAADVKSAIKLQDGNSALAVYPDGAAAVGLLAVAGSTDGEAAMKLTKRLVANLLLKVLNDQEAEKKKANPKAEDDPAMKVVKQALTEQKLDPILGFFGPIAATKGVTITANTSKDGDATCDVLDVAVDWTKMGGGDDAKKGEAIIGAKTAASLCTSKTKLAMAFGPGALEIGKKAVQGKAAGLADAPVYKAATAQDQTSSWVMYFNPGTALAAFKNVGPVPQMPGDRAAVLSCQNRTHSFGCEVDVPVELIASIKNLAGGGMQPVPAAPAPVGAPAPTVTK